MDTAVVIATVAGPILAVQAQKYLERLRERKREKQRVFNTLMATRVNRMSTEHVEALNRIELAFYGGWLAQAGRNKRVVDAWVAYNTNLNIPLDDRNTFAKRNDLFTELLYQMSQGLGYKFTQTYIKNSCYRPSGHVDVENELDLIRKNLLLVLTGKAHLSVASVPSSPENAAEQAEFRQLLVDWTKGNVTIPVSVVKEAEPQC